METIRAAKKEKMKQNFKEKVYELVKKIPKGKVTTYSQVATLIGYTGAARAVGNTLHQNTNPEVPCHRVVNKNGKMSTKFALGGIKIQKERLTKENVPLIGDDKVHMKRALWKGPVKNSITCS